MARKNRSENMQVCSMIENPGIGSKLVELQIISLNYHDEERKGIKLLNVYNVNIFRGTVNGGQCDMKYLDSTWKKQ